MSHAKNIGAQLLSRANLVAAAGEAAVNGKAEDLTALPARATSLRAVVAGQFNADSGDTLNISAIKLQSSADSGFTTPVDRVAGANLVITGVTGDSNLDKFGQVVMDYDIMAHMAANPTHKWLRGTATPTRSDTTNTAGAVAIVFEFGGLSQAPQS